MLEDHRVKLHPDKNNIILDARGAKCFVENLPKERWRSIDTVVWDPPYYDKGNPVHEEIVNKRSKLKSPKIHWGGNTTIETRIMDKQEREEILDIIRENLYYRNFNPDSNIRIMHLHSKEKNLPKLLGVACHHVWIKPIEITIAGNCDRDNGEHILVEGQPLKGKLKGQILNKYIYNCYPEMKNVTGTNQIVRGCAKPEKLFSELYRHFNSKHVLDPFAGYGRSISAALSRDIKIDACDIDLSLERQWNHYKNYNILEKVFDYES